MTALSFADISEADVRAVRQSHPLAFGDPLMRLVRIATWSIAIGYLLYSFHLFEFAKLFDSSERAWRLVSRIFYWQDMARWHYSQMYVGIAQTIAMAFLGTFLLLLCIIDREVGVPKYN